MAQSLVVEAAPTWKGIVQTAEERQASLIVIGSHRHGGLMGHVVGNIASAVVNPLRVRRAAGASTCLLTPACPGVTRPGSSSPPARSPCP